MKKLVFMFVAVAAIAFASCGNKVQNNVEAVDSIADSIVDSDSLIDSTIVDSAAAAVDSAVTE